MNDLTGKFVRSNGKYEPRYWEYYLVEKIPDGYYTRCLNAFNSGFIHANSLDGYEIIEPLKIFKTKKEIDKFISDAKDRHF